MLPTAMRKIPYQLTASDLGWFREAQHLSGGEPGTGSRVANPAHNWSRTAEELGRRRAVTPNTGIVIRKSLDGRIRRSRDYIWGFDRSNCVAVGANQLGLGCAMGFMLKDRIITSVLFSCLCGWTPLSRPPALRLSRSQRSFEHNKEYCRKNKWRLQGSVRESLRYQSHRVLLPARSSE